MCNESQPFPRMDDPAIFWAVCLTTTMPAPVSTEQTARPAGRQRLVAFRLRPSEYEQLIALAEDRSTTMSDLLRTGLLLQGWRPAM